MQISKWLVFLRSPLLLCHSVRTALFQFFSIIRCVRRPMSSATHLRLKIGEEKQRQKHSERTEEREKGRTRHISTHDAMEDKGDQVRNETERRQLIEELRCAIDYQMN